MAIVAFFVLAVFGIAIFPMLIPYLLTSYMVLDGIASRLFINNLKFTVGGFNIYFLDILYATTVLLAILGMLRLLIVGRLRTYTPSTRITILLVILYFTFFVGKLVNGYFEGVPTDSLVRRFALDTQFVYLFLPLFYLKGEKSLKHLLYYVVFLSLIFPLIQPFLYGSADQVALEQGQHGTLRLGFNYSNLLLMMGVLALFVWERKLWLSALPLAGIAMLAQRSAYVSITICIMVLAFLKKKSAKFIVLVSLIGLLMVAALVVIQAMSSVHSKPNRESKLMGSVTNKTNSQM